MKISHILLFVIECALVPDVPHLFLVQLSHLKFRKLGLGLWLQHCFIFSWFGFVSHSTLSEDQGLHMMCYWASRTSLDHSCGLCWVPHLLFWPACTAFRFACLVWLKLAFTRTTAELWCTWKQTKTTRFQTSQSSSLWSKPKFSQLQINHNFPKS